MDDDRRELLEICEQLSEPQVAEVEDFARFLLAKQQNEAWERTIADARPRPKLRDFVRESLAEGSGDLDVEKM